MKADQDVAMAAVQQWGGALKYVSEVLRSSQTVVLAAARQDSSAIAYGSPSLLDDPEIHELATKDRSFLSWAYWSEQLKCFFCL
jgi:hypothetical protein